MTFDCAADKSPEKGLTYEMMCKKQRTQFEPKLEFHFLLVFLETALVISDLMDEATDFQLCVTH